MKLNDLFIIGILFLLFYSCKPTNTDQSNSSLEKTNIQLGKSIPTSKLVERIPELAFYKHRLENALLQKPPILQINKKELYNNDAFIAQQIAIRDTDFLRDVYHRMTKEPLRTEIMNVRKALPSDLSNQKNNCTNGNCYRVELYNYFYNSTTIAIVDIEKDICVNVSHHVASQATINPHLNKIALAIALNSPEVIMALGINPNEKNAVMSNVTTALNGTKCERSKHLCVAPTFVVGDKALWTIVDLTDWQLVGLRWTDVGKANKSKVVTERSLQDEFIMTNFCDKENEIKIGNWNLTHRLTSSDGLEVINVHYKGQKILESAKIVDWHVSYSFKEGFGYNDAMGCPMFSTAAVVAFNAPYSEDIIEDGKKVGIALIQDFRSAVWPEPCNYRYQNRFEFYNDGTYRIAGVQLGRGCGITGVYRPVFRIHVASPNNTFSSFEQWKDGKWNIWGKEAWHLQSKNTSYNNDGYLFKLNIDSTSGYFIEPNQGQFGDNSKGDFAYTYVTKHHKNKNEGQQNMVSFGSCCATDFQQGPEQFMISKEEITNQDLVIWYVPQMANNDKHGEEYCWAETRIKNGKAIVKTWPGIVGPKFIPFNIEPLKVIKDNKKESVGSIKR